METINTCELAYKCKDDNLTEFLSSNLPDELMMPSLLKETHAVSFGNLLEKDAEHRIRICFDKIKDFHILTNAMSGRDHVRYLSF